MENKIYRITGLTPEERSLLMYEYGLQYLTISCRGITEIADEISGTKSFWNWWKYHWQLRDQSFTESLESTQQKGNSISKQLALQLYQNTHSPVALSCELNMNAVVLQDSYALMVDKLNHEIKQEA